MFGGFAGRQVLFRRRPSAVFIVVSFVAVFTAGLPLISVINAAVEQFFGDQNLGILGPRTRAKAVGGAAVDLHLFCSAVMAR